MSQKYFIVQLLPIGMAKEHEFLRAKAPKLAASIVSIKEFSEFVKHRRMNPITPPSHAHPKTPPAQSPPPMPR
jgi:hypothetical protein